MFKTSVTYSNLLRIKIPKSINSTQKRLGYYNEDYYGLGINLIENTVNLNSININ